MNKKMKNTGVLVHTGADRNEISADDWNKGIKCITLLYHWGMIEGYEDALRIMGLYQNWIMQGAFKHDETLLPQLQGHFTAHYGAKDMGLLSCGAVCLIGSCTPPAGRRFGGIVEGIRLRSEERREGKECRSRFAA